MHEASIVRSVIDALEARIADGTIEGRIVVVCMKVGRLTAAVPENLEFMFGVMSEGTGLEGSRLEIEQVPLRLACRACGRSFETDQPVFACASCGARDVVVESGRELVVESVEVDS